MAVGYAQEGIHRVEEVVGMATGISAVTVQANAYKLPDGSVMRDCQAVRGARWQRRKGRDRPQVRSILPASTLHERLLELPRMSALRARIVAKEQAAAARSALGC